MRWATGIEKLSQNASKLLSRDFGKSKELDFSNEPALSTRHMTMRPFCRAENGRRRVVAEPDPLRVKRSRRLVPYAHCAASKISLAIASIRSR